jgi:glycosyltransferase involved in cell wall biosynthesis
VPRDDGPETATPRTKICFIIGTLERGGAEGQLVQLAVRLDRRRFEPRVCCLAGDGPHRAALEASGVPVAVLDGGSSSRARSPWALAKRLVRLILVLRAWRPDLVHGFLYSAYVLGAIAARATGVPIVVASRRSLGFFKESRPLWLWIERRANRATDCLIANSEAVRQDVLRQEGVPPSKVIVIYNGVEPSDPTRDELEALRAELDLGARHPIVIVVANLIAYKGHDVLFGALPDLAAEFPQLAVLLVGDGVERRAFEARARSNGLSHVVRFLGSRHDVTSLLALADVVMHPSTQEGFSNAVLEAMAAGKPVVAAAVGGNVEAIVEGETGFLVRVRDADALAKATARLLRQPTEAGIMGAKARARVQHLFTFSRMVAAHEQTYERLLAKRTLGARAKHRANS